ncbi:MAG: MBL fold metallo-hydrolase [Cyanobacteria bacterium J06632_19]
MLFRQLFDSESSTYTYLIADYHTKEAVIVDSVLEQFQRDMNLLNEFGLNLRYCLDTHVHADHITATGKLRQATGCLSIVPKNSKVKCADSFMQHGQILQIGAVTIEGISTPGHTNSHMSYLINNTHLLTGDALFIRGCGRTDFQDGDAGILYDCVTKRLFTLPDDTLVYPGHDYKGCTVSTIAEEKRLNPRFAGKTRDDFINLMENLHLPFPKKIKQAVPANRNCGM